MAFEYVPYEGPVVTRAEAQSGGELYYFTGKCCSRGHVSQRFVSSCGCLACHSLNGEAWASKNGDRRRKSDRERYAKDPGKYALKNKTPRAKAYAADYYRRNRERLLALDAARRAANPDIKREQSRKRYAQDPLRSKEKSRNDYARRKLAVGTHTQEEIAAVLRQQKYRCASPTCRKSIKAGYHEDHIKPLIHGGSNWISNIQLLCPPCNLSKGPKDPLEWARSHGMLV